MYIMRLRYEVAGGQATNGRRGPRACVAPPWPTEPVRRGRRAAVAAAGLAAAVVLAGLGSGIAALDGTTKTVPQRLTPADKHVLRSELRAALASRRKLDWRGLSAHGERALHLAEARGQARLAEAIRGAGGLGCFASATEFHLLRALRIVDALPSRRGSGGSPPAAGARGPDSLGAVR
jgi:hypothetical protein